ncbi:hypothetical protein BpHYR1_045359 [Brachionus plicatilis]|uniref:Uncharacterized protein n=1 Tax=Brachionus plicatilis TaxID=10195 RepID=A0A3M7PGE4_BRAPC|nr:hypothetical protein BpHYR1_045359 [Brachionus plicatilis]
MNNFQYNQLPICPDFLPCSFGYRDLRVLYKFCHFCLEIEGNFHLNIETIMFHVVRSSNFNCQNGQSSTSSIHNVDFQKKYCNIAKKVQQSMYVNNTG